MRQDGEPDAGREDKAREEIFATMQAAGFSAYVFDNDYGVETYLYDELRKRPVAVAK